MPGSVKRAPRLPLVKDLLSSAVTTLAPIITVPVKTVPGSATARNAIPLKAPAWLVRLNVGVPLPVTCVVEPAVQTVRPVQDIRRVSADTTVAMRPSAKNNWVAPTIAIQRLRAGLVFVISCPPLAVIKEPTVSACGD